MIYHAVFGQVELLSTAFSVVADIDLVRTVLIVFLGNIDIVAVVHDIKDIIAVGDNFLRIYRYFFRFGFRRLFRGLLLVRSSSLCCFGGELRAAFI